VALDLRHPEGVEAFRVLLDTADVLVESFRPGTLARAGLAPDELLATRPRLVACSITGFGQTGPLSDHPGHDLNYQGYAGIVAACGGDPIFPYPVQVADVAGGSLMAAVGILAALLERERTGQGRWLDVSMTEGVLALFAPHLAMALAEDRDHVPGGEMLTGGYGGYRTYRCAEGGLVTVAPLEPKFWISLVATLGDEAPETADPEALAALFARRPRDAWVELLKDACVGPALHAREVPGLAQFAMRGAFETVLGIPMAKAPFPWSARTGVRQLGEDTRPVLSALGVDVDALVASGAAAVPPGME
jgi:crotonobetainyl-CoA:carnitine CoA-transferase CaiB-like acyl-CoA transferase